VKLTLNGVEVMFRGIIWVLKGVSLELNEGQMVALLGANGAGKTTTLKAISGLLLTEEGRVTAGAITLDGLHIENRSPEDTAKLGIIQCLEGRRMFEHLTIEQNLLAGAHARPDRAAVKRDLDMVYGMFPQLKPIMYATSGWCSGGEQQMTVFGRAIMARPKILLMDEASLGLSPIAIREIYKVVKRFNEETKTTILVVEQNAAIALEHCVYGYVMENGRVVLDGSSDKLRDNQDVKEFYLGLTELGEKKSFKDVKHYKRRKRWL